jgi:hypothetical protein
MGGSVSQVQQPQTSGQSSGKGGPVAQAVQQVTDQASAPNTPQPVQQQSSGKGMAGQVSDFAQPMQQPSQPMGKGGRQTNSATSGQPRMGMGNQYSNTVGQWDNTQQQPQPQFGGGKGKG